MRLPQFTAEASLYRSGRTYGNSWLRPAADGQALLVPQLEYGCMGRACVCHGAQDCLSCALSGSCAGQCSCDGYGTCVCDGSGGSLP
jgi:hypothetical protein